MRRTAQIENKVLRMNKGFAAQRCDGGQHGTQAAGTFERSTHMRQVRNANSQQLALTCTSADMFYTDRPPTIRQLAGVESAAAKQ